jgi:hypothetical protein
VLGRPIRRRSDRFIILDAAPNDSYEKWLFCDTCKERLAHLKGHDDSLICPNCGEEYPLDRGSDEYKNRGKLGTIEDNNSSPAIVQPRNYRRLQKQKKPYEQMMEEEIQNKGFTLIDSHWMTRE